MALLARREGERMEDYLTRVGQGWDALKADLRDYRDANEELSANLLDKDGQLGALLVEQHCKKKLHPIWLTLIQQTILGVSTIVEEAKLQGKPYIVLGATAAGALGLIGAYIAGHGSGRIGDALTMLMNAGLSGVNVRASAYLGAKMAAKSDAAKKQGGGGEDGESA